MKYLCLVYGEEKLMQTMDDNECAAYGNGLKDKGVRIAAEALQPVSTATTVRVRDGKVSVTNGPFAETKEQLAGFYLIDAKDLERSKKFFTELGFSFDPKFTDDKAACLVIGDNIFAMLLTEPFFKTFTSKEICDSTKYTEVLLAIDQESREKVDELVRKAVEAGGSQYSEPQAHGWMYHHAFADPDGHQWEVMYADESKIPHEA